MLPVLSAGQQDLQNRYMRLALLSRIDSLRHVAGNPQPKRKHLRYLRRTWLRTMQGISVTEEPAPHLAVIKWNHPQLRNQVVQTTNLIPTTTWIK